MQSSALVIAAADLLLTHIVLVSLTIARHKGLRVTETVMTSVLNSTLIGNPFVADLHTVLEIALAASPDVLDETEVARLLPLAAELQRRASDIHANKTDKTDQQDDDDDDIAVDIISIRCTCAVCLRYDTAATLSEAELMDACSSSQVLSSVLQTIVGD